MRAEVFDRAGVTGITINRARIADRPADETRVYPLDWSNDYGTDRALQGFDGTGGWIGAPSSVMRYLRSITGGGTQPSILTPASRLLLNTRPNMAAVPPTAQAWLGPLFYPYRDGSGTRFEGIGQGSDGGCMYYSHNPDGVSFVFATNTIPTGDCWGLGGTLKPVVLGVASWPAHDLFGTVP